jgi:hypothetical protein
MRAVAPASSAASAASSAATAGGADRGVTADATMGGAGGASQMVSTAGSVADRLGSSALAMRARLPGCGRRHHEPAEAGIPAIKLTSTTSPAVTTLARYASENVPGSGTV